MPIKNTFLKIALVAFLFLIGDLAVFEVLKKGMDQYYGIDKDARILCVGHSHTVLGIDAQQLERKLGVPVAKYATAGANALDRQWMLRHFLEKHPTVTVVVYDVDPRFFDSEGLSSASYTLFLPYIGDSAMSHYIQQQATWQEYYSSLLLHSARFRDQTINIALRGLLGKVENKKNSRMRIDDQRNYLEREKGRKIRVNPESLKSFQESIDYLTAKGIKVVLTFIPVVDLLNEIDPDTQERVVDIFRQVAAHNENVIFLDYNRDYQHNHELFYDLRHLNNDGNRLITDRLVKDLRPLLLKDSHAVAH
jgi:hypothetical protein